MADIAPIDGDARSVDTPAGTFPGVDGVLAGRFHIEARLGAGGMGEVYRARDTVLRRLVAIKRTQHAATEADRRRFLHEGQRASALNHPGIAAIYDVFSEDGEVYLVMEYIEGETLRARLTRPVSQQEFKRIAIECAAALAAAHDKGILHRDIKPENIMLTVSGPGNVSQVKLLDFGLAQQATDETGMLPTATALTVMGTLAGTPQYMAPEVLSGAPPDRRADIFALGVVYYEMLSGTHPFAAPTTSALIGQVLHQPPRPLDAGVPASSVAIVNRALAKSPAERYQSAHEIVHDLSSSQSMPLSAPPLPLPRVQSPRPAPRRWWRYAVAALLSVLLGATVYLARRHAKPQLSASVTPVPAADSAGTIAVLPATLVDSNDNRLASFGRGLAENLAARLSALSVNHDVTVLSAHQLDERKVTTFAEATRELGASVGLAIKLTRQGDVIHAAYTLHQAEKSASQPQLLACGTVTAPASDMFSIENQLATATAAALHIHLRRDEQRVLADPGTTFPEAYQFLLQGRGYLLEATTSEKIHNAQSMFNEALRVDPNYGQAKAALGESWLYAFRNTHTTSDIERAQKACDAAVALGNAGAQGHVCLGRIAQEMQKPAVAATEYQRALQLAPANDSASIGLAKAYEALNQPDKAEAVYQQYTALHPNFWRSYDQLGGFYFRNTEYAKAEQMYRTATEKYPQSFRSYSNLAAALSFQGKEVESVAALKRSIALRPTAEGFYNLGVELFGLRRFDEAAEDFRRATQASPAVYGMWSSLGDAEYYGGHRSRAIADYKKSIQLATEQLKSSPRDTDILASLANVYSMLGDATNALEFLNRALAINHTDKELMFIAANVYNQLHQTGPALEWLGKALAAGYSPSVVAKAPALDNLHAFPQYQQLIQSASH